jgi:hypothetical protein
VHGHFLYDEGVRVPLLFGGGPVRRAIRSGQLRHAINESTSALVGHHRLEDIRPSVLDLVGVHDIGGETLHSQLAALELAGVSISNLGRAPRSAYSQTQFGPSAISGTLYAPSRYGSELPSSLQKFTFRIRGCAVCQLSRVEQFDLSTDPSEEASLHVEPRAVGDIQGSTWFTRLRQVLRWELTVNAMHYHAMFGERHLRAWLRSLAGKRVSYRPLAPDEPPLSALADHDATCACRSVCVRLRSASPASPLDWFRNDYYTLYSLPPCVCRLVGILPRTPRPRHVCKTALRRAGAGSRLPHASALFTVSSPPACMTQWSGAVRGTNLRVTECVARRHAAVAVEKIALGSKVAPPDVARAASSKLAINAAPRRVLRVCCRANPAPQPQPSKLGWRRSTSGGP